MFTFAIISIAAGILFLAYGLLIARKICTKTRHKGWKVLSGLIACFIVGYSAVLVSLIIENSITPVLFGLSIILLSGSVFVLMVASFSLKTISQLHVLAEEEKYNALHDSLTSLPNRKHCIETIQMLIEQNVPFQLMHLDVVNFKQVNDGMGHFCGDHLLMMIGQRIRSHIEKGDFVARIGGDEFVVILPKKSPEQATQIAKGINIDLNKPFVIDGFELTSGAVMGVSTYPSHGQSAEQLINAADIAMYWAKSSELEIAIFSCEMNQDARRKLKISRQIDEALENNRFQLFYQPIISCKANTVEGYEALMRWVDPEGVPVDPVEFIPVAEQSNKITSITAWILNQIALDLATFQDAGIQCPIHVNLSAKDLMSRNIENLLTKLACKHSTFVRNVVLELTETAAINRLRDPENKLRSLKDLGFQIALDDFGTGYSSLSLLRDLPVDQIKIDRSFVYQLQKNQRNRSIVENSIALAHGLGYSVVAEGVENQTVYNILRDNQCDFVQGYFFSPALPIDRAIEWTHNHQPNILTSVAYNQ